LEFQPKLKKIGGDFYPVFGYASMVPSEIAEIN